MAFVDSPVWHSSPRADPLFGLLKSRALRDLLDHWREIRGARLMPSWCDIDPCALKPYLPYVWSWIYDRQTNSFTGRIAGEEINALFGRSLRHMPMADFFQGWDYATVFERYKRVVSGPNICLISGLVYCHAGRRIHGQRLILPLARDGEQADGIIGITIPDGDLAPETDIVDRDLIDDMVNGTSRLANIGEEVHFFPLM